MTARTSLTWLFSTILAGMAGVTLWASLSQPVWQWGGLVTAPDRAWTIATLCDAYAGFLTFYAWVYYRERPRGRAGWLVAILLLGNIAMSAYMLLALRRWRPGEPVAALLTRRAG